VRFLALQKYASSLFERGGWRSDRWRSDSQARRAALGMAQEPALCWTAMLRQDMSPEERERNGSSKRSQQ
jgi:hypothetical protein